MRSARPLAMLLLLALVATTGACSGSHGARAWAAQVCQTLEPWRADIGSLTTKIQAQMSATTTPGQAKEHLMTLFSGARDASETARVGVAKAGVPDVDNGKTIADGFVSSLASVRDAYSNARDGIGSLPTAPAESFYDNVATVVTKMNKDYSAGALDTSKISSAELQQAFDELPECR